MVADTFICAICERETKCDGSIPLYGRYKVKPPICRLCEEPSYPTWNGRGRCVGKVSDGAFGDRRMARRLFAIADALECAALQQQWETKKVAKEARL